MIYLVAIAWALSSFVEGRLIYWQGRLIQTLREEQGHSGRLIYWQRRLIQTLREEQGH